MARSRTDITHNVYYPKISTVTIANGQTVSGAADLDGCHLFAIQTPAALTGVAFTFQVADTLAGTYAALYDDAGVAVSVTVAASRVIYLDPTIFAGFQFVKVVSGSAEGASRVITLFSRPAE